MVYVRKKKSKRGNDYYQLVESCRVEGKPRQRVILHLGRHATVEEALKAWPRDVGSLRRRGYGDAADKLKGKLEDLKKLRGAGAV